MAAWTRCLAEHICMNSGERASARARARAQWERWAHERAEGETHAVIEATRVAGQAQPKGGEPVLWGGTLLEVTRAQARKRVRRRVYDRARAILGTGKVAKSTAGRAWAEGAGKAVDAWLDAGASENAWKRTFAEIMRASAGTTRKQITLGRARLLTRLGESEWRRVRRAQGWVAILALERAPEEVLREEHDAWVRWALVDAGAPRGTNAREAARMLEGWRFAEPPPLEVVAALGPDHVLESPQEWAGACRIGARAREERRRPRDAGGARAGAALKAACAGEEAAMRAALREKARRHPLHQRLEALRAQWRAHPKIAERSQATLRWGKIAGTKALGWTARYDDPMVVLAVCAGTNGKPAQEGHGFEAMQFVTGNGGNPELVAKIVRADPEEGAAAKAVLEREERVLAEQSPGRDRGMRRSGT